MSGSQHHIATAIVHRAIAVAYIPYPKRKYSASIARQFINFSFTPTTKSDISSEESLISAAEPYISSEKPFIHSAKSHITAAIPFISTEQPFITSEKLFIPAEKPDIPVEKSYISFIKLHGAYTCKKSSEFTIRQTLVLNLNYLYLQHKC